MIIAFFTPYYKFLQKDNFIKFFNDVNSLQELIDKIKIEDKIKVYAYSKDIIKFQFSNTNPNIEYDFLTDSVIFEKFINENDKVKVKIQDKWNNLFGEYIYFVQDRKMLIKTVKDFDICSFQATDMNDFIKNVEKSNDISFLLTQKMFFTDEEIEEMA